METDIVPALLEKIKGDFAASVSADGKIQKFLKRIRDGTADMDEASLFARRLGDILADVLERNVTQDILPGGRMYYNIADRTIRPMLEENFKLANEAAKAVQALLDEDAGIRLNAMGGTWPEERVDTLIGAIGEDGIEWEETARRMDEPVRNISQSFFDEFVRKNAEFRHKAGMSMMIVRKLAGGACPWCRNLAGAYDYSEAPKDVYRRHDNCKCTVTFRHGRVRVNVWTKEDWLVPEQITARKLAGPDLVRRTPEEAEKKEANLKEKLKK